MGWIGESMGWKGKSMGWIDCAAAWIHKKAAWTRGKFPKTWTSQGVRFNAVPYSAQGAGGPAESLPWGPAEACCDGPWRAAAQKSGFPFACLAGMA